MSSSTASSSAPSTASADAVDTSAAGELGGVSAFRSVPRTGVIFVTTEAQRRGFHGEATDWCNLGQGMPEAGPLEGAPPRVTQVDISLEDQEYAPVPGLWELRESVAGLYNQLFRRGMPTQYSAENVAISGGGRAALTRVAAALGHINMGHFLPDYTAYEELLDVFRLFAPIPILLEAERGYGFSVDELRKEVLGRGLSALLLSNPCNPTGKVVGGEELAGWTASARELDCTMIFDEFYSHYVWRPDLVAQGGISSAARYVEDVDRDPVVILDGLTKNWRYPGWRVTWTVGPRSVIDAVGSAGSFLDGGASRPLQRAAISLLDPEHTRAETQAISRCFAQKRTRLLSGLRDLGLVVDAPPEGTFYVWASVAYLPPGLDDGMSFFRAALDRKVIAVPGEFFDVDPGKRRGGRTSRFTKHLRFSFGPSMDRIEEALSRIGAMIEEATHA
ncbi:pyridoxal phosphate-dependent aminotransferase [Haliangium ochraceum]|uniref:Aminotransferase class I and II n=1 Tax=Haliangium ochraceum (strain DSM 14365 / JCM 11303 / SMP-2) TaxID=502025 RepID=D0LXX3_HALO1|nr:pyridoxal phosphate-dependent aminotransferase [Haliangium ochraceum]ACY14328.1 aminotransferase class I and II [Haliangium ochraceum DSM 14365]